MKIESYKRMAQFSIFKNEISLSSEIHSKNFREYILSIDFMAPVIENDKYIENSYLLLIYSTKFVFIT